MAVVTKDGPTWCLGMWLICLVSTAYKRVKHRVTSRLRPRSSCWRPLQAVSTPSPSSSCPLVGLRRRSTPSNQIVMLGKLVLGALVAGATLAQAASRTITVDNQCKGTIWPAFAGPPATKTTGGKQPFGWAQPPGTTTFTVPDPCRSDCGSERGLALKYTRGVDPVVGEDRV